MTVCEEKYMFLNQVSQFLKLLAIGCERWAMEASGHNTADNTIR